MVQALSISENIHTILRVLYDDMMVLCYPMAKVATAIAGIGALIYIAYRIWQAMARPNPSTSSRCCDLWRLAFASCSSRPLC